MFHLVCKIRKIIISKSRYYWPNIIFACLCSVCCDKRWSWEIQTISLPSRTSQPFPGESKASCENWSLQRFPSPPCRGLLPWRWPRGIPISCPQPPQLAPSMWRSSNSTPNPLQSSSLLTESVRLSRAILGKEHILIAYTHSWPKTWAAATARSRCLSSGSAAASPQQTDVKLLCILNQSH